MPKKKKTARKVTKRKKVKAKGHVKSRTKSRSRVLSRPKKTKKIVPLLQYRAPQTVKPPKGPLLTKTPFSKAELELFKKILTDLRRKLVGDIQKIEGETLNTNQKDSTGDLSGYSFHMADVATDSFDRELNIGLASSEQLFLNDVDDALKKIEEGTYGICEKYGVMIPKKRLLAAPYVRFCLQAQEEQEKETRRT